jgi:hypothetical protein
MKSLRKDSKFSKLFSQPLQPKLLNTYSNSDHSDSVRIKTPVPRSSNSRKFNNSPGFKISQNSRFQLTTFEKFKCKHNLVMSSQFHARKSKRDSKTIIKNKNMKQHSPSERIEKIRRNSEKNISRMVVNKIARFDISCRKKEEMEMKINEKFKKLFFRQKNKV